MRLILVVLCALAARAAAAPAALAAPAKRDFYGPAVEDYRATADDFRAVEDALAGALKLAPKLFPRGIGAVDVVLQDTSDFYIYSRERRPGWKQVRRWRSYRVYQVRGHQRPPEHEMWGCAGGPPSVMEVDDRRIIAEHSVRCAPWGSFRAAQVRKRSYYKYREAYLATMVHELAHQYELMTEADPPAAVSDLRRRAAAIALPAGVDRDLMAREAFAEYCELAGSKTLYPPHYYRMLDDAAGPSDHDKYGHHEALQVALDALRHPATR